MFTTPTPSMSKDQLGWVCILSFFLMINIPRSAQTEEPALLVKWERATTSEERRTCVQRICGMHGRIRRPTNARNVTLLNGSGTFAIPNAKRRNLLRFGSNIYMLQGMGHANLARIYHILFKASFSLMFAAMVQPGPKGYLWLRRHFKRFLERMNLTSALLISGNSSEASVSFVFGFTNFFSHRS